MLARLWMMVVALVAAGFLTACAGPQKAEILKTTAIQFTVEAGAAIDAIDEMYRSEIASPQRSDTEAVDQFVANVIEWDASPDGGGPIAGDDLEFLINPDQVDIAPQTQQAWEEFVSGLRLQYAAFAAIFERLPQGSFLATAPVKDAAAPARSLTAQLAALAVTIDKTPPRLIQSRNAIASELNSVPVNRDLTADQKRRRIAELREQAVQVIAREQELRRAVVEQLAKASAIGAELTRLIDAYDQVSTDDLLFLSQRALGIAGQITGEDYGRLQARVSDIANNPDWQPMIDAALEKANAARKTSDAGLPGIGD